MPRRQRSSYATLAAILLLATGLIGGSVDGASRPNHRFARAVGVGPVHEIPPAEAALLDRIEDFRCQASGNPAQSVDVSCNASALGQRFGPDNEISIAVNPENPNHLVAGSNDYFFRFEGATRLANVASGFFTSFDGGRHWIDGQIPFGVNNQGGDPAPVFDAKHDTVLFASLDFNRAPDGVVASDGHVVVSRSTDGGRTWAEPERVMRGRGADTDEDQVFWDKEFIAVDNYPSSPHYGRAYVTATRFLGGPVYRESPIWLSYSDDGGRSWSRPKEISGSHASCTYQETGGGTDCDEDQFSIPEVAPDGTLYVHFANAQNDAEWEIGFDFDDQIMVTRSDNGGRSFSDPVPVVQLEDGYSDMPFNIQARQTIWGFQFRWASLGNISVNPRNSDDVSVVFADRGTANPNATEECYFTAPGNPPAYDPCNAGPGMDTDLYLARSTDGGQTWSGRRVIDGSPQPAWYAWADHKPNGTLVVAYDEATAAVPADHFNHKLWIAGRGTQVLRPHGGSRTSTENPDVSATHWAGQYVPQEEWPTVCGPAGYSDPPIADAEGKDCNVFLGDYTGLAVGSDGKINVVWTGMNRLATSPQIDPYTGERHDGYVQDAMFARR